jgi:putative transposase
MSDKNPEFAWRTGRYCLYKNFVHLVFVTKYRRGVFDEAMITRLHAVFRETCEQMGCELIEFNGEDDHVHLMLSYPPQKALSNLISKLKGKDTT